MLVLTRKNQEEIVIGDSIKVTVLKVKGSTVKLGIEAPKDLRVRRSELIAKDMAAEDAAENAQRAQAQASVAKTGLTLGDYLAHKEALEGEEGEVEDAELSSSDAGPSIGNENSNRLPLPGSLVTAIVPPCISVNRLVRARPSPVPP